MYCTQCGNSCGEGENYCIRCGAPLNSPSGEPAQKRKGRHWPPLLMLALMFTLGFLVFLGTRDLSTQAGDTPWFQVTDGELSFDPRLYSGSGELTIPAKVNGQTVSSIAPKCFAYCDTITTVILPDTVSVIGRAAFVGCTSLRGIFLPEGVVMIDELAFAGCASLEAVCVPSTVEEIGVGAFRSCPRLNYILYSGTYRNWQALYHESIGPNTQIYTNKEDESPPLP